LVPGYGAQGATSADVALCFNSDGMGAIINASRSITCEFGSAGDTETEHHKRVFQNVIQMIEDIGAALARRLKSSLPSGNPDL
jgi:orotidine-5'-phosphate decarboxylase